MSTILRRIRSLFGLTGAVAGLAVAAALIIGMSSTSHAAPLVFDITLTGTSGTNVGVIGTGTFAIESTLFTGVGEEVFCPLVGCTSTAIHGLLSLQVEFAGDTFALADDESCCTIFPIVVFFNGIWTGFNFFVPGTDFDTSFLMFNDTFSHNGVDTTGTIAVSPIPLPAALPLYGTGLAVMGFIGWRRRRQAQRD